MTHSPDLIFIRDLEVPATIGIYAWEQRIKQTIKMDVELSVDIRKAAQSGLIEDAISYVAVIEQIKIFVAQGNFTLLEVLAEQLAQLLLRKFKIETVCLHLHKVAIVRDAKEVGVMIKRTVADYP